VRLGNGFGIPNFGFVSWRMGAKKSKAAYDDEFGVTADSGGTVKDASYGTATYKTATYGKEVKNVEYNDRPSYKK
jgi:hypothetical protein